MADISKTKFLIIGNSAGGIAAAEAIRGVDKNGAITVISDEPYPAYSRPLISEYLGDHRPLERMLYRPADFYDKNNISTMLGKKVKRLDVDARIVELEGGTTIAWSASGGLLLATGGVPIIPPTKGINSKGVFTFTTLDDAKAIDEALSRTNRAVVIGGGFIGVSVTEALRKRGVAVTIVEMKERILNTILDPEASAIEEETLKRAGVKIVVNHTVTEVNTDGETVDGVTLDDGSKSQCGIVVLAIGVRPRTDIVAGTKIKVNRGILVDRHMETSVAGVYACGDAAEAYDFVYCEDRLSPVWPNAYLGGRVAGLNMASVPTEYAGGTGMNSMNYFGLDVAVAGVLNPPASPQAGYETLSKRNGEAYRKIVLKDGFIVGLEFVTAIEKAGIIYRLMKDKVNVESFKKQLISDDFGLLSLPDELWRKGLEMPVKAEVSQPVAVAAAEEVHGE